jgi:transcriptional regulator with XRE-family HTH domain
MEFHEKLQELRKHRGLTQEELAEILFVSRTAVSKWESGRGMPSIDSLKDISAYFSVSIDDLLSGEKLILLAQQENRASIQTLCQRLFAAVDLLTLLLIVLPLYPKTVDGRIYSVPLWQYSETAAYNRAVYWFFFLALMGCGIWKLLLTQRRGRLSTAVSLLLSLCAVLYLVLAREAYAATVTVVLLTIKTLLVYRQTQ